MNKKQLNNSIFLIGPTCVGKSLLSVELGERLDMQVVNIDDLILYVEYEIKGVLSSSKKRQNDFIKFCIRDIKEDKVLSKNLKDKNLADKQAQLVYEFIENYNRYIKMFGSLKPFHKMVGGFLKINETREKDIEYIVGYSALSTLMMQKIISKLNYPVVFDTPAMFGWKLDEGKVGEKFKKYLQKSALNIRLGELDRSQEKMLKNAKTVFLEPGLDYQIRNAQKNSSINKLLLKHIENYYDYANISITTNAMFNHPENKYFEKRSFFDAKEYYVKEKLKNKCNIDNICDEIISMVNDLNQITNI